MISIYYDIQIQVQGKKKINFNGAELNYMKRKCGLKLGLRHVGVVTIILCTTQLYAGMMRYVTIIHLLKLDVIL
jgi:hypothetical protein